MRNKMCSSFTDDSPGIENGAHRISRAPSTIANFILSKTEIIYPIRMMFWSFRLSYEWLQTLEKAFEQWMEIFNAIYSQWITHSVLTIVQMLGGEVQLKVLLCCFLRKERTKQVRICYITIFFFSFTHFASRN